MMDIKQWKNRLTRAQMDRLLSKLFRQRRLLLLCGLGAALVYTFDLLYSKAYIETNYVDYPTQVETIDTRKESATLEGIMQKTEERKHNLAQLGSKTYSDPFNFRNANPAPTN